MFREVGPTTLTITRILPIIPPIILPTTGAKVIIVLLPIAALLFIFRVTRATGTCTNRPGLPTESIHIHATEVTPMVTITTTTIITTTMGIT